MVDRLALRRTGALGVIVAGMLLPGAAPARAETVTICTLVADLDTGKEIHREGDCATRVTPASTFKTVLAMIGYDSGFLKSPSEPVLSIEKGEADWGGDAWRRPTDPTAWMEHSVVWYSQRMAKALGAARIEAYLTSFGYGNADMSGDPGKDNGLMRGWIASSLKVSPEEQVRFAAALANGRLPVKAGVSDLTIKTVQTFEAGGWRVKGKTGSAFPRKKDGNFDRARAWGWFVGWGEKDGRRVVFARLNQDRKRDNRPSGIRARDGMLKDLPGLVK